MVYIFDKDGKCWKYGSSSGMEIVVEYKCINAQGERVNSYVACTDMNYAEEWMRSFEFEEDGVHKLRFDTDGVSAEWYERNVIVIDPNNDYHFYYNKNKQIVEPIKR